MVGHDWGGTVAWATAMHHPEVVDRLAILNAAHPRKLSQGLHHPGQLRKSWYFFFFALPELPESVVHANNWHFFRNFLDDARPAYTPEEIDRYVEAWSQPGLRQVHLRLWWSGTRPDRRRRPGVAATAPVRAVLDQAACLPTEPDGPPLRTAGNRRAPERRQHGIHVAHHPPPSPWRPGRRRGRGHRAHGRHRRGAPPAPMAARPPATTRPDPGPATGTGRPPPGYVLERGRFTPVAVPPGVEDPSALGIGPTDLNDRRQIVGIYDDVAADAGRGFLLDRGRFTTVHVPGAMSTQA